MWGENGPWIRGLNRKTGRDDEPGSLLSQCRLYGNLPTFAFWRALSSERQQMDLVEIASTLFFFKWRLKWCNQKKTNVCFMKHLPDNIKVWFLSLFIIIIIIFFNPILFSARQGKTRSKVSLISAWISSIRNAEVNFLAVGRLLFPGTSGQGWWRG